MNNLLVNLGTTDQAFVVNRDNMTVADYSPATKELTIRFVGGTNITLTMEAAEGKSLLEAIYSKS